MKCEQAKNRMIDALKPDLTPQELAPLDEHLRVCASCRQEMDELRATWQSVAALADEEPGPGLREKFYAGLQRELLAAEPPPPVVSPARTVRKKWLPALIDFRPAWQFAATLLLLGIGFAGGYFYQRPSRENLQQVQRQADQIRSELSLVMLERSSAGDRLQGVRQCAQLSAPDDRLIDRLLEIVNADDNIHVRLAAVDALYLFGDRPEVRQGVTRALSSQNAPLMQVALIDLLVSWREKQAAASLKALSENGRLDPQVQARAKEGLVKLL